MATPKVGNANEHWKDLPGYEQQYSISNQGRVASKSRVSFCTPRRGSSGYVIVTLYRDGKGTSKTLHRLLALAFIDNPENKPQVNHIDGNKTNNALDNLEWATPSENGQHAAKTGLLDNSAAKAKVRMQSVGATYGRENIKVAIASQVKRFAQLDEHGNVVAEHENIKAFCREKGYNSKHFFTCLKTGKPYRGIQYQYITDKPAQV